MCRKASALLLLLVICPFLTACFDAREIGDYAYVAVMGIERGISDTFRITFQIPDTSKSGGGGGGSSGGGSAGGGGGEQKEEKNIITVEAPSFFSAVPLVNSNIPKTLNFMHLEAMVISEDLASSGKMGELVTPYVRFRQIRRTTELIICKGKAEEFVRAIKPYAGGLVTQTMEDLIQKSKTTGLFPITNLNDAYAGTKSNYHSFLGVYAAVNKGENLPKEGSEYTGAHKIAGDYYAGDVPRKNGQEIEFLGSVVFKGDKMVGKLTGFETQMLLLMRGELERVAFTIPDPIKPEFVVPIEIKEFEKPKIKVDISGNKPKIDAKISIEGDIIIVQSRIYYEKPDMTKIVEAATEKYLEEGIKRAFEKCKNYKSDVFKFGAVVVRDFLTIPEWEEYNWLSKFPESELSVKVDFTVRRTGKMLKSMPVVSPEGKE
jgi:Ger(x)C family germination protein